MKVNKNIKAYVAGHRGMVGSAIVRRLKAEGYNNIITRTRAELDLTNQQAVADFFALERPEQVFLAAAKVGGIVANNTLRADFIYENLMIQNNVIHNAHIYGVKKLLFLGSSCIYPRMAEQPMKEEALLTGILEQTNEPYAIAKIAGIKMCDAYRAQYDSNFISAMPTNLYGEGDNYDLTSSHVIPAMIRKMHEAKVNRLPSVELWGTGTPLREFMHVDDVADASLYLMKHYSQSGHINVGTGEEFSIEELAGLTAQIVGYGGKLHWDTAKPDGTPRKLMDSTRLQNMGWQHKVPLEEGLREVYQHWSSAQNSSR